MTSGRSTFPGAATAAGPAVVGFQPARSRWTWQPRLPELWLREHEGRRFREMILEQMKKK
jgi:hypothetical protein